MNSNHARNKKAAIYVSDKPTKTDQSQASTTDINVIVTQFLRTGHSPGQQTPIYGDFTEFPQDLQTMFALARSVKAKVEALPIELQGMPLEQLAQLTPQDINAILATRANNTPNEDTPK